MIALYNINKERKSRKEKSFRKGFFTFHFSLFTSLLLEAMTMTSCSDFLDILPMNDVVLQNYWTQKGDA